jgi:hypothetical protein
LLFSYVLRFIPREQGVPGKRGKGGKGEKSLRGTRISMKFAVGDRVDCDGDEGTLLSRTVNGYWTIRMSNDTMRKKRTGTFTVTSCSPRMLVPLLLF